jgi:hypothetical protein
MSNGITRASGSRFTATVENAFYDKRIAQKLLAQMQGDTENGLFRLEKYTRAEWSEPADYLDSWLAAVENTLSPATVKDYENSTRNFLRPFFKTRRMWLHEIGFDTLMVLANTIQRGPKGKRNVVDPGQDRAVVSYPTVDRERQGQVRRAFIIISELPRY